MHTVYLGLFLSTILALAPLFLNLAYADVGVPTSISATYDANTGTLSVSGGYDWDKCKPKNKKKFVGFAIFIDGADPRDDPSDPRVLDGAGMHLANNGDPCKTPFGSWSDTHTLADKPNEVCVVIYDVRWNKIGRAGVHSDVGAGNNRNHHNSFEEKDDDDEHDDDYDDYYERDDDDYDDYDDDYDDHERDDDDDDDEPVARFPAGSCTTPMVVETDLSITKTGSSTVTAGEELTYTITVNNAGPNDAQSAVVTDILPEGVTFDSATSSQGPCSESVGTVTCDLGTIAAGDTVTITIVVRVNSGATGTLTNTASVSSGTFDPNDTDNSATADTPVEVIVSPEADLEMTKSGPTTITAGEQLTYTITVTNAGPSDTSNVVVTDSLPSDVTFVSATPDVCVEAPAGTLTCDLGTVTAGSSVTITIVVTVNPGVADGTIITNSASVSSSTVDPDTNNNSNTEDTPVRTKADLSIDKAISIAALPGETIVYAIEVTNDGPSNALNVVITDAVPADLTFNSGLSSPDCSESAGTVTCLLGALPVSGSVSVSLAFDISAHAIGIIGNTASVTSDTMDTNTVNNSDTVETEIGAEADLILTKISGSSSVIAGSTLNYTITVSNVGPSDAMNVEVTDSLPSDVTLDSESSSPECSETSTGSGLVTCDLGTIAAGDTVTITIVVTVNSGATGTLTNTASVSSGTFDPNDTDNSATADTTITTEADLSVTKFVDPPAVPGEQLTYTITVTNAGPSDTSNVVVTDSLPSDVTFVSATPDVCVEAPAGTLTCDLGTVTAGSSVAITIVVTVNPSVTSGTTLTNTASVSSDTAEALVGDETDSVITEVGGEVDLSIETLSPSTATTGDTLTYEILVTNEGPDNAFNVVVRDALPPDVEFVSVTTDQVSCSEPAGIVVCDLDTLSVGDSFAITVMVTVNPDATGTQINNVSVSSSTFDPDLDNNSATATTEVQEKDKDHTVKTQFRGRYFPFGDQVNSNYDDEPPMVGEVITGVGSLKILAEIRDNVGVKEANILVGEVVFPMIPYHGSQSWWVGIIPSSALSSESVSFRIVARDYNNNEAWYPSDNPEDFATAAVPFGASSASFYRDVSITLTPSTEVGQEPAPSSYSIHASGVTPNGPNAYPEITIKNTGNETLQNIRLALSPELKGKFLLSNYAIKSIDPQSEAIIWLIFNGKPDVDATEQPVPYEGKIIISINNFTPYVLDLSGEVPNSSARLQSVFMNVLANKGEQRYRIFAKPDLGISHDAQFEVRLRSGNSMIKSTSDELIIFNTGEKPLKNVRIITSSLGDHFLPDKKNIQLIPAGSSVKVKLTSKLNGTASKDLRGELIVVPENGVPAKIPIHVNKSMLEGKNAVHVETISGNDAISNASDGITIRNNSSEPLGNVRLILSPELERAFSLSQDYFESVEPNSEKIVYLQHRGTLDGRANLVLGEYLGKIILLTSHGINEVPVDISWRSVSTEHFDAYVRNNVDELVKVRKLIDSIEQRYHEVTDLINGPPTGAKKVVYIASSIEELKMLKEANVPSTFIYGEDVETVALRQFVYGTIMQSYSTYWTKQKISMDDGNWLVDGISNYIATNVLGENGTAKVQLESFISKPATFEWYGAVAPSQYGATNTLFMFLSDKYGDGIIDGTLGYLGSTMISNHRCDTFEQCALLRAVYDASGLQINDKRHDLSFDTIIQEWKEYLTENYDISETDLS